MLDLRVRYDGLFSALHTNGSSERIGSERVEQATYNCSSARRRICVKGYGICFNCAVTGSKKGKENTTQSEKRIAELDKLFTRLYEDNVSGKISDERFEQISTGYDNEQKQLNQTVAELQAFIEQIEQKRLIFPALSNLSANTPI